MKGITIDHVAIMVSDLEKSLHFYRDILGMEVVSPEEHDGGPIDEMTAMSNVHMREYRLRPPGGVNGHTRTSEQGFTFDLIQWINPESPTGRQPLHHVPSAHFCFGVEDVPATYERLKAAGVEIVSPPVRFEGEGDWHVLFFYDPDGNLLELNEIGTGEQAPHDFSWSSA
jgi:catechol 2,3-dioxygenase-like lactoylglutathione lyase family enzyme